MVSSTAAQRRKVALPSGANPIQTLRPLWQGPLDPVMQIGPRSVARAMRLSTGPATLLLHLSRDGLLANAWGPAADEALDLVPALVGVLDEPGALVAEHEVVRQLQHRLPGLRLTRGTPLAETLLTAIVGQKITSREAQRSLRALAKSHGDAAPGPLGLRLLPSPEKLAGMPYWALHPAGIERRRADAIRIAAAAAPRLTSLAEHSTDDRLRRLTSLPGIGPWTAAEAVRTAYGDPDAVSIGDYHLPRLVCAALAGEPDGGDARMLELLEPYRGQRARVVLLLESSGLRFPRRAPRMAARSIGAI